jgi:hypothetical protein
MKHFYLLLLFTPSLLVAQLAIQPVHQKKIFVDSAGRYYQQASLPVYLMVAHAPDGKPVPLQAVNKKEITLEGHGVHAFKHENHINQGFDEFQIYADGIAPITRSAFQNAPAFLSGNKQYYGTGLSVTLSAKDEMSGIEQTYHAINGETFKPYAPTSFAAEGSYTYDYYSTDRTGNAETLRTRTFTVDLTAPNTYHHFIGISSQSVISTNTTIYLTMSDTLSGVAKTFYRFDKENFKLYTGGNIPFQYLADGDHTLTYFSVDNVTNKETEKSMKFYLDKTAPIMSADVLGDKFLVGEKVYFSGRTKLKLTAVDNKSGIKEVMFSINDQPYEKYNDPFYLPNRSGIHNVRFYANDNTSNNTKDDFAHSIGVIYVDLTGPALAHTFNGPTFIKADTVFVSPKTTITISGNDPEAGLKKLTYSYQENSEELPYTKPISIPDGGAQKLFYFGYDNVNNKNAKETFFVTDRQGPQITSQFAVPPNKEGKYPSYTTIYLAAVDAEVGADGITYSINGAKEQPYIAPLKGFAKNKEYTIKVNATDLLGNKSTTEVKFKTDRY